MINAQRGFTLIELMLVIVIISIFAAMVGLSVGGTSERQLLQQRERLIDNLALIRLESADQGRVLALQPISQTATQSAGYAVVGLDLQATEKAQRWPLAEDFKSQPLPDRVRLVINSLASPSPRQARSQGNTVFDEQDAPRLIWFGNGEVTPARLQLMQDDQPIGAAIYVTATGLVSDDEQGGEAQ